MTDTAPTGESDPALMAAFLAEPIPGDANLGPLVMPNATDDIPNEKDLPRSPVLLDLDDVENDENQSIDEEEDDDELSSVEGLWQEDSV